MIPRWLIWTLVALVCWGIWAVIPKWIGDTLTARQSQALSTVGALPVMLGLLFSKKLGGGGPAVRGSVLAFAAGALACGGNIPFYALLNSEKAATVVPLTSLYPLVTVLLAVPLLKERLNRIQIAGVIFSFVAIYLFNVSDKGGFFTRWLLVALAPVVFWGVAGMLQKISTNSISGELSTLWFLAATIPVAVFLFIQEPLTDRLSAKTWALVTLLGLTSALGNYAILDAFASGGKASIIAPLAGLYPMISIPIAIVYFREQITPRQALGIVIALAAVAAISVESKAEKQA